MTRHETNLWRGGKKKRPGSLILYVVAVTIKDTTHAEKNFSLAARQSGEAT